MENLLQVLNFPDQPTFHGHNFQHSKVDDLVIVNTEILTTCDISLIKVHTVNHFGSDHYPISFEVVTNINAMTPVEHLTLQDNKKEEWCNILANAFKTISTTGQPPSTPQELDSCVKMIIDTLAETTRKTMKPNTLPSHHKKHWWNDELSDTLVALREQATKVKQAQEDQLTLDHYNNMKAIFHAKVCYVKQHWATSQLESATSKDVWEFIKWHKHSGKCCHPLYSSPSHIPADNEQDRANCFRQQFFPKPPPTNNLTPSDLSQQTRIHHPLLREEVQDAIAQCSTNSAPGPSQTNYKMIKWAWSTSLDILFELFQKCLQLGHYPEAFKHTTMCMAPKPNKADYSIPGSFHPIQLVECLAKILDKVITKRIQFEVSKHNVVPMMQFSRRIHSLTIDAGLTLTQDIHEVWSRGQKVSVLFFDISGFFDFVNHDRLIQKLKHYSFDNNIINIITSFLHNRSMTLSYDRYKSEKIDVPNGIPQGSPLLPILTIIYSTELLQLKNLIHHGISSYAYMDNGAIMVCSSTLKINMTKLQNAFQVVIKWLTANGPKVQPSKIELMHFTKGPDSSSPALHLPGTEPIVAPKHLRWLGFFLDQHLSFIHHTKIMAMRVTATARAMYILGNTVCGMSHVQLRQLTLSTIILTLTYGCQLWWNGRFSKLNTERLQKPLNIALRIICRVF